MATIVTNCPRCKAQEITFDTSAGVEFPGGGSDWQRSFEAFSECRRCHRATIFVLRLSQYAYRELANQRDIWTGAHNLNRSFEIRGFVSVKDVAAVDPPEHIPADIAEVFKEGATCMAVGCFNAASTMFRLCLDKATQPLLPAENNDQAVQPNRRQRRDLGLRIPWLIERGQLPGAVADLAAAVREDGNDGAHAGNLGQHEAEDLLDFTTVLLERLYTEPERIRIAENRRQERRGAGV